MKQNMWIWNHYATNTYIEKGGRHYWFAKYLLEKNYKPTIFCASTIHNSDESIDTQQKKHITNFATIIHPSVYITPHIEVGEGTIICVGNHFTTNIKIGEFCIIDCYISIGHDAIFNDFVSIMSNSAFGGDTLIGQGCYFGLSCTVINKIKIGEWSVIGAGTTVVNDIPPYSLAVGVPAKVIKTLDK